MNKNYTIAVLGSHSALDVCRGAKDFGFKTLVIVQKKGDKPEERRDQTYSKYYKTQGELGCVDEVIYVNNFKDILNEDVQQELLKRNSIFIPNRSFEVYINDYDAIENKFKVPMFGNRKLLKIEERGVKPNQYDLLDAGNIRYPKQFKDPKDIDSLCIVKVLEKERGFERAFFLVGSGSEYYKARDQMIKTNKVTEEAFENVVIEEFVAGVQVNFNFFFSPIEDRLELLGTDTRRQTNVDGFSKLSPSNAELVWKRAGVKWEEAGHIAVTVLESMLEDAFALGEKFVKVCKEMDLPIIGPFALQTAIIPGPPKKEIIVFDISPRMPGSPGIASTPYGNYLYGEYLSMGKRVAMEIKEAIQKGELDKILT